MQHENFDFMLHKSLSERTVAPQTQIMLVGIAIFCYSKTLNFVFIKHYFKQINLSVPLEIDFDPCQS